MTTKRKITVFIALICLLCTITLIQKTYAKYITNSTSENKFTIARWKIKINNLDMTQRYDIGEAIQPVFAGTENIKPGVLAPTAKGYFDIIIDASETDVSFEYNIEVSPNAGNTLKDLKITKVTTDWDSPQGETELAFQTSTNETTTMRGAVKSTESDDKKIIGTRFYLEWVDDERQTQSNIEDVEVATSTNNTLYNVSVSVIQTNNIQD